MKQLTFMVIILVLAACTGGHNGTPIVAPLDTNDGTANTGPNTPDISLPDTPTTDFQPTQNENPETSDRPDTPIIPDTPAIPSTPSEPEIPEIPSTPDIPFTIDENIKAATNIEIYTDNKIAIINLVRDRLGTHVFENARPETLTKDVSTMSDEELETMYNDAKMTIINLKDAYDSYIQQTTPEQLTNKRKRTTDAIPATMASSTMNAIINLTQAKKNDDESPNKTLENNKSFISGALDFYTKMAKEKTFYGTDAMQSFFDTDLKYSMYLSGDKLILKNNAEADDHNDGIIEIDLTKTKFNNGFAALPAYQATEHWDEEGDIDILHNKTIYLGSNHAKLRFSEFALITDNRQFIDENIQALDARVIAMGYENKAIPNDQLDKTQQMTFYGYAFGALDQEDAEDHIAMRGTAELVFHPGDNPEQNFKSELVNINNSNDIYNVEYNFNMYSDNYGSINVTHNNQETEAYKVQAPQIQYYSDNPLTGNPTEVTGYINSTKTNNDHTVDIFDISFGAQKK